MSLFGISIDSKGFWNGCKTQFKKARDYLSKVEDISGHDVAKRVGGLEAYPVRDDLWTIRPTSLRGGGYNRYHRFHSSETGVSLVGMASVLGVEGSYGNEATIDVAVFAALEREPEKWFPVKVEISSGSGGTDDFVAERHSRIFVDGDMVLEWRWARQDGDRFVRQRVFYGFGNEFRPLMERLEYKRGLGADSIRMRLEWEDTRAGETETHRSCVETTGKGLWEACMGLNQRMQSSTQNLIWNS